ncbi:MAG: putative toxin-antitoxin system toxin component, PIN family [Acidobacteria bacterium]|nr:putative toxin-antitoxin system toxin component, PIN family [Acidobacteriota bacterium]
MRIVLDTNVLVSALISPEGSPGRVLAAVRREGLTLVTSESQLAELKTVLSRDRLRPCIHPGEAEDLLRNLEAIGDVVAELPDVNASSDPDDNLILATAIAGRADLIVSGDKKHMLALGWIDGIPIVTAAAASERVARRDP